MIDIHAHVIQNVDDGSDNIESSLAMIENSKKLGVTSIICTPHFRKNMFETSKEKVVEEFSLLQERSKNLGVDLFLGREIFVGSKDSLKEYINSDELLTMNNTKFLLLEFRYTQKIDIADIAYSVTTYGFNPIIAHVERYEYIDENDIVDIRDCGAMIQVNASSICGKNGRYIKKYVCRLLKNHLVDFIASDVHHNRTNYLKKAYSIVSRWCGKTYADKIFYQNQQLLLTIK